MFRLFFLLLLLPSFTIAQTDTMFFNEFDKRVEDRSEATQFRLPHVKEGDSYKVTTYYMDGTPESEGYSRSADSLIWNGGYISYHKNGRKASSGSYVNGYKFGTWKHFYEDTNRVHAVIVYNLLSDTMQQLRSFYRSGKLKRLEYRIKKDTSKSVTYEPYTYESKGVCYNEAQEEIKFTPYERLPEFKGKITEFLARNIRYPDAAREVEAQGRVNVQFALDTTGKIFKLQVIKPNVHPALIK